MKAQFTIEFIVASAFFVVLIVYTITSITNHLPIFRSYHKINELKSNAFQISEVLIFDQGDWDKNPTKPIRIGLASGYYVLNNTKLLYLNQSCGNDYANVLIALNLNFEEKTSYEKFMGWVLMEKKCVRINIYNTTNFVIKCGPQMGSDCETRLMQNTTMGEIVRYALDENDNLLNMTVLVW